MQSLEKNNKVVVIGIDGATFDIILPMIERGELPTFRDIMDKGARAKLMSTYPPHTVPAWISCATGMNPGKLGFFDFRKNSHQTYDEGDFLFSSDIQAKPLWTLLSESNKKVMVIGVPLTYPPGKVNGIMVSPVRLIAPDKLKTYPPELSAELMEKLDIASTLKERKDFMEMHTSKVDSELETFLDKTVTSSHKIIEKLTEVTLYLLDRYEYSFGMFMLTVDALQHHLWCFMDKDHPSYNPELACKYSDVVFEGYRQVDNALKKILSKLSKDTTVILMSDHGFGPLYKMFNVNRWLIERGLLKLKKGKPYSLALSRAALNTVLQKTGLGFLTQFLPEGVKTRKIPVLKRKKKLISELIDWQSTKAYATSYAININLKGREPEGTVEPGEEYSGLVEYLKSELCQLRDPDTGHQIIDRVLEKKELYCGPYVEDAPDILVFFKDPKYSIRKDLLHPAIFRELTPEDRLTGHHTSFPNGICIMKGPHIVPGAVLKEPNIMDIAPTILYLLGEPVSEDMDGRVLIEAIDREYINSNQLVASKYSDSKYHKKDDGDTEDLTEEDKEAIKNRLNELGYMG